MASAQSDSAASLRLFSAGSVTLDRREARRFPDLGLWVASVGGEFRLNVRRPDYRRWEASQVDPSTGRTQRVIPARLLDGWDGLRRFIDVRLVDARGRPAGRLAGGFCPGSFSLERVDPEGAQRTRYSTGCSGGGSPFLRGAVWGIDAGWATPAAVQGSGMDLRPGRYTAVAAIAPPYRRLFAISPANAVATVRVRIVSRARGTGRRPRGMPMERRPPSVARAAQLPSTMLPDLVALPAWDVGIRRERGRDMLRFASTAWNAGPGPLVVEGFRRPGRAVMDAFQYAGDGADGVAGRAPAGIMEFERHGGHDHWHFRQFATYRLLDARRRPVVRATKAAFCLFPTDAIDLTVPGAVLGYRDLGLADGSACGSPSSIWIRETLPAGWGDTYGRSLGGQAFNVTRLRNGRYFIEIRVNARNLLHETTTANNVQLREVRLRGRRGSRSVRVMPWNGIRD